jgi:lipopolysaccharide/colanic/teichoic acid biosynthesis glycosyltransferase
VHGLGLPFHASEPHLWVWYFVWASLSYLLLLLNRTIAHVVLKRLAAAGHFDERVAVFGAGPIARRVRDHLVDPSSRLAFAGMYDDRPESRINPEGLAIAGRLNDLIAAAHAGKVDRIIVALPAAAEGRITGIAKRLESAPASVHIVTHLQSDLVEARPNHAVSALGPVGMLDVKDRALSDWAGIGKRGMDVVVGSMLMIVALPLMAVIAGLVALGSSGPVFVSERRRGLNNQTIDLVRFRTTRTDDMAPAGVLTPIGRILVRHGLDDLPQLWSVLKGEMSLVGPRPFPLDETAASAIESAANLHQVKPGLTGLDRVSVGSTPGETREPDLVYIERWSPSLDLQILGRSLLVALFGRR